MALSDLTLAQLARARAGTGPVRTLQATLADVNGAPTANDDGVDVSGAVLAVVKVRQDTGAPVFTIHGRTEGDDDEWEAMNHLTDKTAKTDTPWKEIVFVGPEAEIYVEVTDMGGAAMIDIIVEPCNG